MTYPTKVNYYDIKKTVQKPFVLKNLSDLYTVRYTLKNK